MGFKAFPDWAVYSRSFWDCHEEPKHNLSYYSSTTVKSDKIGDRVGEGHTEHIYSEMIIKSLIYTVMSLAHPQSAPLFSGEIGG